MVVCPFLSQALVRAWVQLLRVSFPGAWVVHFSDVHGCVEEKKHPNVGTCLRRKGRVR